MEDIHLGLQLYQVILLILASVLVLLSLAYIAWTLILEKDLLQEMKDTKARIEDDMILYPRCRTAAEENGLEVITPWKEFFTRDNQPFKQNKLD